MTNFNSDYRISGGPLRPNDPYYVPRQADEDLYQGLIAGKICLVLSSRQMGKTSLLVRVMQRLRSEGFTCAFIEMGDICSQGITQEEFYANLVSLLIGSFHLDTSEEIWWQEHQNLSPKRRASLFLEQELLNKISGKIIIFLDEIDRLIDLDFKYDFFEVIGKCYKSSDEYSEYERLNWSLLGVATIADLIGDSPAPPLIVNSENVIELTGLGEAESLERLEKGLQKFSEPRAVLRAILKQTRGQPYLTQWLCYEVAQFSTIERAEDKPDYLVESIASSKIVKHWQVKDKQQHLLTIENRFLSDEAWSIRLLETYRKVRQISSDFSNYEYDDAMRLKLTGLVVEQEEKLKVRNLIYSKVFDEVWIEKCLADIRLYAKRLSAYKASNFRNKGCLLRGKELEEARIWTEGRILGEDDYKFLSDSREREARRRTWKRFVAITSIVISPILGGLLIRSEHQRQISLARQLTAEAELLQNQPNSMTLRALLGLEATKRLNEINKNVFSIIEANLPGAKVNKQATSIANVSERDLPDLYEVLAFLPRLADSTVPIDFEDDFASQNGQYVAKVDNNAVRIEEKNSGKPVGQLLHKEKILAIAFSPDGNYVATASADDTAQIWETTSGELVGQLEHEHSVHAVAFSPNENYVATASADGTAKIWEVISGSSVREKVLKHRESVLAIAFSPDGNHVATASADDTAQVWETSSGEAVAQPLKHEDDVNAVTFSPDGNYVATASDDKTARVWSAIDGQETTRMLHEDPVESLSFTNRNSLEELQVTTKELYGDLRRWNITDRAVVQLKVDSSVRGKNAAFSSDGQYVAAVGEDTVQLWRTASGKLVEKPLKHTLKVNTIALSPNGQCIILVGEDKLLLGKMTSGGSVEEWLELDTKVDNVALSPDGQYIAVANANNARLWKKTGDSKDQCIYETDRETQTIGRRALVAFAFSPNSKYLATVDLNNEVRILETSSNRFFSKELEFSSTINSLQFSPEEKYIAIANDDTVKVWDLDDIKQSDKEMLKPRYEFKHEDEVNALDFSPDEKYIASGSDDDSVRVWNLSQETTESPYREFLHRDIVSALDFGPEGKYLASASEDRTVQIWDISSGKREGYLPYDSSVTTVMFNLDSRFLTTLSNDGIVQRSPWHPNKLIEEACRSINRNLTKKEWQQYLGSEPYRYTCPNLQQ